MFESCGKAALPAARRRELFGTLRVAAGMFLSGARLFRHDVFAADPRWGFWGLLSLVGWMLFGSGNLIVYFARRARAREF